VSGTLRALVFDVDGTLAETERDGHRVAFNQAFADAGNGWHWDPVHYGGLLAVTGGKERLWHHWRTVDPAGASRPEADDQVRALHRHKTRHYMARVAAGCVGLRPGVKRLLAEAKAGGLVLAIATTTTPANVDALLAATLGPCWASTFEVIGAGDIVPRKKPAPDIYHWVLDRLQLPAGACLAIEDSAAGAAAAAGAGLATVLTRSAYSVHEDIPGVLCDLDGLGEPGAPAAGRTPGPQGSVGWEGVVDLQHLRQWHAIAARPLAAGAGAPAAARA
jgi:beta-phosphoglucomutase-like phosphatase (HAD superfamily)